MMKLIGTWIKIQSYKHDGSLHRFWKRNFVLVNDENWLIVASKKTRVVENNGRIWYTKEPAISFFSKKAWFNTIAMLKENGVTYYTNIATPTLIDQGIAKYIDYDLDIKRMPDGSLKLLDRNEFKRHIGTLEYAKDLVDVIFAQADKTQALMSTNKFPFDDKEVHNYYNKFLQESKVKER